jgi:hypothetical protein
MSNVLSARVPRAAIAAAAAVLAYVPLAAAATDYGGYRPSYQGFGVNTPGGRGGAVCKVTNLNDSGSGSLRSCLEASGPRFVIFETSGTITISYPITVTNPYVTIAGQTAPSPGILVRGPGIIFDTHDAVIQHLRIRVGNIGGDPIGLWLRDDATNIVVDHVSVSWGVWDNVAIAAYNGGHPTGDITITDSILAEALGCSGVVSTEPCDPSRYPGSGYSNSRGLRVGDGWGHSQPRLAVVRTLDANTNDRHPEITGGTYSLFMNNLYYNPSQTPMSTIMYEDYVGQGPIRSIVKNNLLIPGPTTPGNNGYVAPEYPEEGPVTFLRVYSNVTGQIYMDGNYYAKDCGGTTCLTNSSSQWSLANDMAGDSGTNVRATSAPFSLASAPLGSAMPYTAIETFVTANAGARPLDRDAVDARLVGEVLNRRGSVPNRTSDKAGAGTAADGFPTLAANTRALTVPDNPNQVVDAVGRTRIEQWLESYAVALEPASGGTGSTSSPTPTTDPTTTPTTDPTPTPTPTTDPTPAPTPTPTSDAPVTIVNLTASVASPQTLGTTVVWTATPGDGTAPYQYKWLLYDGNTGNWVEIGDWTTSNTYSWQAAAAGNYQVAVWVRSGSRVLTGDAEASAQQPFSITSTRTKRKNRR